MRSLVPFDFDLDGDLDVLGVRFTTQVNSNQPLMLNENLGRGIFGGAVPVTPSEFGFSSIVAGDLTGDGMPNLVISDPGRVSLVEFMGPGQVALTRTIGQRGAGVAVIELGDIDNDGDLDVVAGELLQGRVVWLSNDGSGQLGTPQVITTDVFEPRNVELADLDGDGDLDVASASSGDNKVAWYANDGSGVFGPQQVVSTPGLRQYDLAISDMNLDGNEDIVAVSSLDGNVSYYQGLGGGAFAPAVTIGVLSAFAESVVAVDVDQDGWPDVVAGNRVGLGNRDIRLFTNLGGGTFGPEEFLPGSLGDTRGLGAADFDQDSDVDIYFTSGVTLQRTDLGMEFCSSLPNSTGALGRLAITGSRRLDANAMTLQALGLPPSSFGFFLASPVSGPGVMPPGSQGILCLGGAIGRYQQPDQIQSADSSGRFQLSLDLTAMPRPTGAVPGVVGETWRFQAWHRDVLSGLSTSNFTSAANVTFE